MPNVHHPHAEIICRVRMIVAGHAAPPMVVTFKVESLRLFCFHVIDEVEPHRRHPRCRIDALGLEQLIETRAIESRPREKTKLRADKRAAYGDTQALT